MNNLNTIKKKFSKIDKKDSVKGPAKLLEEFFNSAVIKTDKEYEYDA